jgi:glycerate kinase
MDSQTLSGKAPLGVASIAKRLGKPVIGIAGSLAPDAGMVYAHGLAAIFGTVHQPCTLEDALANATANLRQAARNIAAAVRLGHSLR